MVLHFNVSNPGTAFSASGFVAVTQGRNKQHYVTLNVGFGQEAYQLIGPEVGFESFPEPDRNFHLAAMDWEKLGVQFRFGFLPQPFLSSRWWQFWILQRILSVSQSLRVK